MSTYLMGIDIGTGQSKGTLADLAGNIIATHTLAHTTHEVRPGWFEHDADGVWYGEFCTISKALIGKSGIDPKSIAAVGASAIGPCVLPVDKAGQPLRPGILYGIDTRSRGEITWLNDKYSEAYFLKTTGNLLSTQAAGPKIRWLKMNEPDIYTKTAHFLTSTSYIVYRLTGQRVIDHYTAAAGFTPLYDVAAQNWSNTYAQDICPPEKLPRLLWASEVAGHVSPEAAQATGLAPGTPVICGTADAAAEAISVGVAEPGDVMLMFGSTVFLIALTANPVQDERLWSAPFLFPGTYSLLGGMGAAGSLTTWFRDQLAPELLAAEENGGPNPYDALLADATTSPPGANGLLMLPYFCGERTPLNDPLAKGAFLGLTLSHTRADLYRALLEGVAYGIADNLGCMQGAGAALHQLSIVGGGTKSPLWMQITADVTGLPLTQKSVTLGASYGNAFLAGLGAGVLPSLGALNGWVSTVSQYQPCMANATTYRRGLCLYRQLYQNTKTIAHTLSQPIEGGTP